MAKTPSPSPGSGHASRVLVGRLGAAHGVKGEIRLKSFTQDPAAIGDYPALTDAAGTRSFRIEALRHIKDDMCVVRLAGVRDRNAAEALTNLDLYVSRADLPPPDEDEFYYADLIGLRAELADGTPFGTVLRVMNYGGGDILEIAPASGETILLPFTKAAVPRVDLAGGRVIVDPPEEIEIPGEE
jgi:16S rRNA processing protein RimM